MTEKEVSRVPRHMTVSCSKSHTSSWFAVVTVISPTSVLVVVFQQRQTTTALSHAQKNMTRGQPGQQTWTK